MTRLCQLLMLWCAVVVLLVGCASPPLTVYTLVVPVTGVVPATGRNVASLGQSPVVIAVARVSMPDELDTTDIVVRNASLLRRSQRGRWASRLSLGITDRLTARLAARRPDALVTDRPLGDAPTYRVLINIGRLDVTAAGLATLDADWSIVPADPAVPVRRDRAHVSLTGPAATDQDVVTLMGRLVDRLADAIDIPPARLVSARRPSVGRANKAVGGS